MRSNVTISRPSRRLAVEWREPVNGRPLAVRLRVGRRESFFAGSRGGSVRKRGIFGVDRLGDARAFTLLELLMVLTIIGILAAMTLPRVGNYNRANTVTAATRQMVDAVNLARSRAIANRSTVYMVFVPQYDTALQSGFPVVTTTPGWSNLLGHQFMSYALVSARTVGDQPGQSFPRYLTEWQTLPTGVYFWPPQFPSIPELNPVKITTTNTFNGTTNADLISQLAGAQFPYPAINAKTIANLPYIAFTPQGTLLAGKNQYIVLVRGSILYPEDVNGNYIGAAAPLLTETPPGNATNNPCMIKIDWLTARPTVVQNQFQ
jgi:prepilin-type N-terminal cleavage/methylation domain-containing protein